MSNKQGGEEEGEKIYGRHFIGRNQNDDPDLPPYYKQPFGGAGEKSEKRRVKDKSTVENALMRLESVSKFEIAETDELSTHSSKMEALAAVCGKNFLVHLQGQELKWFLDSPIKLFTKQKYKQAAKQCLKLIEKIEKHFAANQTTWFGVFLTAELYRMLVYCHRNMGGAGRKSTIERNPEHYRLVVRYATEALTSFASIQQWLEDDVCKREMAEVFYVRGRTLRRSDLEGALQDYKASLALIRSVSPAEWNDPKASKSVLTRNATPMRIEKVTWNVQLVMAMQKVESEVPRPFYTKDERERIELDLGLGIYGKNIYKCLFCGKDNTDPTIKLQKCSRCEVVWACGKDCMRKAWKSFHKSQCIEKNKIQTPVHFIDSANIGALDPFAFETYGVFVHHLNGENLVAVADKDIFAAGMGLGFDALTDKDVFVAHSLIAEPIAKMTQIYMKAKLNASSGQKKSS